MCREIKTALNTTLASNELKYNNRLVLVQLLSAIKI